MAAVIALGLTLLALSAPLVAQKFVTPVPDRSDAGSWEGTWYFVSRQEKVALWIREDGKKPRLKLRYLNPNTREGFTTDWETRASYRFDTKQGKFLIELSQRDANTLAGSWIWQLGTDVGRWETGEVTLFRIDDGRMAVMDFENLVRMHVGQGHSRLLLNRTWTFLKASRGMARWEELPF